MNGKDTADGQHPDPPATAPSRNASLRARLAHLLVALGVLACAGLILAVGIQVYQYNLETLETYRVDGLAWMILFALGLSIVAAPFFAYSLSQTPGDAPQNVKEVVQLVAAVLGILFLSLSLVFHVLWLVGWLYAVSYQGYRWLLGY